MSDGGDGNGNSDAVWVCCSRGGQRSIEEHEGGSDEERVGCGFRVSNACVNPLGFVVVLVFAALHDNDRAGQGSQFCRCSAG